MDYRKFKLIKGNEALDLQGGDIFLYSPSGLGMQNNYQYLEMSGYFQEYSRSIGQMQIGGTFVFFPGTPYSQYQDAMAFLLGADSLILGYQPQTENYYYARVNVVSVDKTELNDAGILEVPVIFDMLSPWYVDNDLEYISPKPDIDADVYPYTYTDTYGNGVNSWAVIVSPNAQMPCDWMIIIKGPVVSPTIKIVRNGKIIGYIDLSGSSAYDGEEIIFTTAPISDLVGYAGAYKYSAGVYTNISTSIVPNINYPAFIQIPGNDKTQFLIGSGNTYTVPDFTVKVRQYYRTV